MAPNTPRPLQADRVVHREQLKPLGVVVDIDGTTPRCTLRIAGAELMSDYRCKDIVRERYFRGAAFPDADTIDIDFVTAMLNLVVENQFGLLRIIHFCELGHGAPISPQPMDVFCPVDDPDGTIAAWKLTETTAEAIIYTWTGEGDRYVVPPRYAELKRQFGC